MRDNADYRAANTRAQGASLTVVCLTTAGRNSPDDGFSPADPTVVIRPCRVATLRTASAPTATNALVSIPLVSIPVHWNGRRDGMDWYPMHWSPLHTSQYRSTA